VQRVAQGSACAGLVQVAPQHEGRSVAALKSPRPGEGEKGDQPHALRTGGELIELFLQDAPVRLGAIREAIAREDWAQVAASAHSLKGSCGSLGAVRMADLCGRLERYGRSGRDRREAEQMFKELESESVLVRDALERER
jgi:HPt (histidine-containing phosphotransfer) domain-containing protein